MLRTIIDEILVRLVMDVIHAALATEFIDLAQRRLGIHRARGIVRRYGDDGARAWSDGAADEFRLELVAGVRGHEHRTTVRHRDRHLVIEVIRRLENHLVAWICDGEERIHEPHVAPGCDDESAGVAE